MAIDNQRGIPGAAAGTAAARRASPADYRDLMSAFPTGVAVVTSMDSSGQPRGMTCSSLSSVTLAPPTLLTCLRTDSGTLGAVRHHGGFAVNLLHARGRAAAELFSSAAQDRFGLVRWRPSCSGLPWLVADAFALAECTVSGMAEVGDHTVVFGAVEKVTMVRDTPLLYGMRRFSALCIDPCVRQRSNGPGAR
jgi:flavin reductase (DIM6/NTAB) family NADH-FMN oxidoreductase RutF